MRLCVTASVQKRLRVNNSTKDRMQTSVLYL